MDTRFLFLLSAIACLVLASSNCKSYPSVSECHGPAGECSDTLFQKKFHCHKYVDSTIDICSLATWSNDWAMAVPGAPISIPFEKSIFDSLDQDQGLDGYRVYFTISGEELRPEFIGLLMIGVHSGNDIDTNNIWSYSCDYYDRYGRGNCLNKKDTFNLNCPLQSGPISPTKAIAHIRNWQTWLAGQESLLGDSVYAYTFDRGCIQEMLKGQPGKAAAGIRFYFALKPSGNIRIDLAAVPYDVAGNDLLYEELDFARPCPNLCGNNIWYK